MQGVTKSDYIISDFSNDTALFYTINSKVCLAEFTYEQYILDTQQKMKNYPLTVKGNVLQFQLHYKRTP